MRIINLETGNSTDIKIERHLDVLQVALDILNDKCPRYSKYYYCKKAEEFDEGMCTRCMENFLYAVANGKVQ